MVLLNLPTLKTLLIVLNLICAVCGIWMALVGLVLQYKFSDMIYFTGRDGLLVNCTKLMIVLGWALAASGFFGIFGAMRYSYSLTVLYVFLLVTLIVFQVTIALILFGQIEKIPHRDVQRFEMIFDAVMRNRQSTERIEQFQNTHGCCGKRSFKDWETFGGGSISKCRSFDEGCTQIVEAIVRHVMRTLGCGLLVLGALQFMGLLLASFLAKEIRTQLN